MTADTGSLHDDGLLVIALGLVRLAVDRHHRGNTGDINTKSSVTDPVTEVDRDSEQLIVDWLRSNRADDAIIGEEGACDDGISGLTWIVDPLDGTVNYTYGFPAYAVSLAVQRDGETVAAVIHDTALDDQYTATLGGGSFCNGSRLSCSDIDDPAVMLLATGFGYEREQRRRQGAVLAKLIPDVRDIRRAGSAAIDLCHVAAGRVDAYYETGPNVWDVAAGMLIVDEAGGRSRYDHDAKRILASGTPGFAAINALVTTCENTNRADGDTHDGK
ncbi:MAG: inositol monophosphatase [Actinomycetia bacterium]|nr:inositol monophosphatase [Actinomycetes bacterium]MCP4960381.1 inositol monophosphatase [Actinomycetes bacterium]